MKKKEWIYGLCIVLSTVAVLTFLPWWFLYLMALGLSFMLLPRKRVIGLFTVLAGLLYLIYCYQIDQQNDHILSSKMSALFGDIGSSGLIILSAFIGAMITLIGSMMGYSLKAATKRTE